MDSRTCDQNSNSLKQQYFVLIIRLRVHLWLNLRSGAREGSRRHAGQFLCVWRAVLMFVAGISNYNSASAVPTSDEVRSGLRHFYIRTSQPDGSFAPGIDPGYRGISDSAYSDLAPVTYAVILHRS